MPLTLNWIDEPQFVSQRPFDLGGLGTATSWRPFDIIAPFASFRSNRPFDIMGTIRVTSERPFDIGTGGLFVTSVRPFDIVDETDGQDIDDGVVTPPQVNPVNAVQDILIQAAGGQYKLTFAGQTTGYIDWDADANEVKTALEGLSNIAPGDVLVTYAPNGSIRVEFRGAYAGMPVPTIIVDATYLTGPAPVGVVSPVTPGVLPGTSVTLSGIQVYDKGGNRLGVISYYTITGTPSRAVKFRGSLSLTMPRSLVDPTTGALYPNPELYLVPDGATTFGDRLLVIGDSTRPSDPWGGVVTHAEWTDGALIVQAADVMDLLSTANLPADDETRATQAIIVYSGTPATNLVNLVMSHANTWFGAQGEVLWGVDASGTETYFGYDTITGDVASALDRICERSFGEWAWRIDVGATTMTPVLVWRDRFLAGAGPALVDGPDGNIVAGPSMSLDPTSDVSGIRIQGSVTTIESKIPAGATAREYTEIIPVAEVWLPDMGYRRRVNSDSPGFLWNVEVPWTIGDPEQDAIAAAEEERRKEEFRRFIHGFHAQYGRPWHDGWAWNAGEGSDDDAPDVDGDLDNERYLTADKWVHWREMGMMGNKPAAVVMKKKGESGQSDFYRIYTTRKGDTLWKVALAVYGNGTRWRDIYEANKGQIDAANKNKSSSHQYDLHAGMNLKYPVKSGGDQYSGKAVVVWFDRVNGVQYVFVNRRVEIVPDSTVFDFEWRRYRMGEYDPQTQGIGVDSNYRTVKGGHLRTRSWRVVPANGGGSGSTSLAYGIDATTTNIPVQSTYPLPTVFPFIVTVGTDEKMKVRSIALNVLTVVRGWDGTTASIHEAGESVEYLVDETLDEEPVESTTPPPELIGWPEGEAYGRRILEMLHPPKRIWSVRLANVDGAWSLVHIGSQHSLNIQSDGPAGGMVGTVRVLGFSPDIDAGAMELILENV